MRELISRTPSKSNGISVVLARNFKMQLMGDGVPIDDLTSTLFHDFDFWHITKNAIFKKFLNEAKNVENRILHFWMNPVRTHFSTCVSNEREALRYVELLIYQELHEGEIDSATARRQLQLIDAKTADNVFNKFVGVLEYVLRNDHKKNPSMNDKRLTAGTSAFKALTEIVLSKHLRRLIPRVIRMQSTSANESANSLARIYTDKSFGFHSVGHEVRSRIAAIHANHCAGTVKIGISVYVFGFLSYSCMFFIAIDERTNARSKELSYVRAYSKKSNGDAWRPRIIPEKQTRVWRRALVDGVIVDAAGGKLDAESVCPKRTTGHGSVFTSAPKPAVAEVEESFRAYLELLSGSAASLDGTVHSS